MSKSRLKFKEWSSPKTPSDDTLLRLDLGTGKGQNKPEGFLGVDINEWEGVQVVDLLQPWPWANDSVDEVQANYLLQYFSQKDRVHFANELYRVLKPGAKALIMTPYWASAKAYGDTGNQEAPISEAWYPTLNKQWRDAQNYVDRSGYTCDFEYTLGYGLHPMIVARNQEYQQHAVSFWKEAAQDLVATLIPRK